MKLFRPTPKQLIASMEGYTDQDVFSDDRFMATFEELESDYDHIMSCEDLLSDPIAQKYISKADLKDFESMEDYYSQEDRVNFWEFIGASNASALKQTVVRFRAIYNLFTSYETQAKRTIKLINRNRSQIRNWSQITEHVVSTGALHNYFTVRKNLPSDITAFVKANLDSFEYITDQYPKELAANAKKLHTITATAATNPNKFIDQLGNIKHPAELIDHKHIGQESFMCNGSIVIVGKVTELQKAQGELKSGTKFEYSSQIAATTQIEKLKTFLSARLGYYNTVSAITLSILTSNPFPILVEHGINAIYESFARRYKLSTGDLMQLLDYAERMCNVVTDAKLAIRGHEAAYREEMDKLTRVKLKDDADGKKAGRLMVDFINRHSEMSASAGNIVKLSTKAGYGTYMLVFGRS